MQVYPTTQHLDRDGQYMGLRTALRLVGRSMFPDSWRDADTESLKTDRDQAEESEAWDRARGAERRLEGLVVDKVIQSFGEDDEGGLSDIVIEQLTKPYFRFSAARGFVAFPNEWVTMYVDGPQLRKHLDESAGKRPRRTTYSWKPIVNEAWRFAVEEQSLPRTLAAIIAHTQSWCLLEFDKEPDESELKPVARAIVDCLGNRYLEGNSPGESPPDIQV